MTQDIAACVATLEDVVAARRADLDVQSADILKLAQACKIKDGEGYIPEKVGEDRSEVIANLMLAYRHTEDARMRLGKVFQAINGGVSNSTR